MCRPTDDALSRLSMTSLRRVRSYRYDGARPDDVLPGCTPCLGDVSLRVARMRYVAKTGIQTDRRRAVGFGRGLQAVDILRNRDADLERRVDVFPCEWRRTAMDASNASLPEGARRDVCLIPVTLAHARDAGRPVLVRGQGTRSRQAVRDLVGRGDIGHRAAGHVPTTPVRRPTAPRVRCRLSVLSGYRYSPHTCPMLVVTAMTGVLVWDTRDPA